MIKITSNIDDVIKKYKSLESNINTVIKKAILNLANQMKDDMIAEIQTTRLSLWAENEKGNLSLISGDDFEIVDNGNVVTIDIGSKTIPFRMNDGTQVNPYFFIEYGFGIKGQNNPMENTEKYGWVYNINERQNAWFYIGADGGYYLTDGEIGTNFLYNTINKYKSKWKEIISQELMEYNKNE